MFPFAVDLAGSPILPLCYSFGDILLSRAAGTERPAAHAKQGRCESCCSIPLSSEAGLPKEKEAKTLRSGESGSEPFRELSVAGFVARQDRHRLLPAFPRASGGFSDDYRRSRRVELFCGRNEQVSVVKQLRRFAFALTASNHEAL